MKPRKYTKRAAGGLGIVTICGCFAILIIVSLYIREGISFHALWFWALIYCLLLWAMNYLNMVYDTADGYASLHSRFGSWPRNTLFGSLLYVYACVFAYTVSRFYDAEALSQAATVEGIMLMGVAVAIFLHIHNEKYLASRQRRIRQLSAKGVLNKGRRFSMIVEKGKVDEKGRVTVYGWLIGEMHRGDRIILYRMNGSRMARVRKIITDGKKVRSVHDGYCAVFLSDAIHDKPERLSVLCGTREYHENDTEVSMENPVLKGYLYEYSRRYRDPVYFHRLIQELVHSYYLVPGFDPSGNKNKKDMMDRLESAHISFPSVNNKDHPDEAILAVFTDWDTLKRWSDMMASPRSAVTMMNFKQILMIEKMGYKGIVINPFGPVPFFLNRQLLEKIVTSSEFNKDGDRRKE